MKNLLPFKFNYLLPAMTLMIMLLPGCTSTFFGSVMVFRFHDILTYVCLALFFAIVSGGLSKRDHKVNFWASFLLGIVLTPLAGLIYLLIIVTKKG